MDAKSRILIVDDNPLNSKLLIAMLRVAGYHHLMIESDGRGALDRLIAQPPDLVLLDVMLPDMSGLEVCRQIKGNAATAFIPVILVTAATGRELRLEGIEAAADDFLRKPIDQAELLARVRSLLKGKRLHDDLIASNQARAEFVDHVSHELRTPLFAIAGLAELLLSGEARHPEQCQRYLTAIHGQARHLSQLVDDLLDLSRFEMRRQVLHRASLRVGPFLDDTLVLLQPLAGERRITLRLGTVARELSIDADEGRLRQALINILTNAIVYNSAGGSVDLGAEQRGYRIVITVRDTGWGIPAEEQPHIFERFYRGQQATGTRQRGIGLGLPLAREIVVAHGGQLSLESTGQAGAGSLVSIDLPGEHGNA